MLLTDAEVRELTGKERYKAQARQLQAWGIPYRVRQDGTLVVYREDIRASKEERPASPTLRLPQARGVLARQEGQVDPSRARPVASPRRLREPTTA